ncbi:hypothetical protein YC2023_041297 [Brassica napus]
MPVDDLSTSKPWHNRSTTPCGSIHHTQFIVSGRYTLGRLTSKSPQYTIYILSIINEQALLNHLTL